MHIEQLDRVGEVADPNPASVRPIRRDRIARAVAVLALGAMAATHVPVAVDHIGEIPYLGYAFYALVLLCAAALGSLLVESRTAVWRGVLVLALGSFVAYVVSRTVGLPLADDDIGDWANPLGAVSVVAELVVVAVSLTVLPRRRHDR
jgi:hypothetical protein